MASDKTGAPGNKNLFIFEGIEINRHYIRIVSELLKKFFDGNNSSIKNKEVKSLFPTKGAG